FREGRPVTGGREQWSKNGLEYGAAPSQQNYFQARFAIRHWWTGAIRCANPVRGVWGGPPDGNTQPTIAASKLAFAPRGKLDVARVVNRDLWEIGLKKAAPAPSAVRSRRRRSRSCRPSGWERCSASLRSARGA